jgi:hypothetical protein
MALSDKKYVQIHSKTGNDKTKLKDEFDAGHVGRLASTPEEEPIISALIYQIGLIQEDLDELRRYLNAEVGDGAQGPAGAKGDKGDTGNTGAAGATGATGARGPAGADGADGSDGADGADGSDGADGTTPTMTSLNGSSLPTRRGASGTLWNNRGMVAIS